MIYRLHRAGDRPDQAPLAENDLPHAAAALDWAQEWLRDKPAAERYSLASADGNFAVDFVRTVGAQWYAIGR